MHGVMRPFGSRIKYDTHSWDQTEDVAGSVFCLSSRVHLCLALGQPSRPPHAELHAAMSHHTNISPKLSLHQSDALLKPYPSTSTCGPRRVTPLCAQLPHEDPSNKQNTEEPSPIQPGVKYDRDILDLFRDEPDQSGPAEQLGSGGTCSWRCLAPSRPFIDSAKAKQ